MTLTLAIREPGRARAERAGEDRAYVRALLWRRQPAFAAALAAAEREILWCCRRGGAVGRAR